MWPGSDSPPTLTKRLGSALLRSVLRHLPGKGLRLDKLDPYEQWVLDKMPSDHSRQVGDWHYACKLQDFVGADAASVDVLDLGAGEGRSLERLKKNYPEGVVKWTGVDIGDSYEIRARSPDAPKIDYYDGSTLPYADASFDVVWCRQVLEHVRFPDKVIAEISRVLRPGGYFLGSVSQLEPYHSRSIFNWTHYGVITVLAEHGLETVEIRPGIDGPSLLIRSLARRDPTMGDLFRTESPFNALLQRVTHGHSRTGKVKAANFLKLKAAGHIHFAAKKAAGVRTA